MLETKLKLLLTLLTAEFSSSPLCLVSAVAEDYSLLFDHSYSGIKLHTCSSEAVTFPFCFPTTSKIILPAASLWFFTYFLLKHRSVLFQRSLCEYTALRDKIASLFQLCYLLVKTGLAACGAQRTHIQGVFYSNADSLYFLKTQPIIHGTMKTFMLS